MNRVFILAVSALALTACGGSSGGGSTGKLSLAVTDAPVDEADEVVVTFTAIEFFGTDSEADSDSPRQRIELDQPVSLDLLDLQGDQSAFLLDGVDIPVGTYQKIGLIVDGADPSCQNIVGDEPSYISIDGTSYPLVVPSGAQSGLKIGPITIAAGGQASYTVDFDLRKSIAERGVTGCYNLRPVLRLVDNAEVGHLAGSVDPDLLIDEACTADPVTGEGAAVYVFSDADASPDDAGSANPPITSSLLTQDADTGELSYSVGFLLAGDYTASLTCQAGDDDAEADDDIAFQASVNVNISAGATTEQDFEAAVGAE